MASSKSSKRLLGYALLGSTLEIQYISLDKTPLHPSWTITEVHEDRKEDE